MSGTAHDSNGLTLPFTMPAGSAFQVLRYQAPVTWAVISGHNARFGFTIPKYARGRAFVLIGENHFVGSW